MKMKKNLLYALALITSLSACVDKLNIDQQGVYSVGNYYASDESAQEALAAVYSSWASVFVSADYQSKVLLADDCYSGGNGPTDNQALAGFSRAFYEANNSYIASMYSGYYTTINRANLIIDNFTGDNLDSDIKRQAVAEARFFRAWCYLELVSLWGNPPLVEHVIRDSSAGRLPNTPGEQTWAFIENELLDIIDSGYLTEKSSVSDAQAGIRPTKQTAQAFLGKAYLYQGKYAEALEQFKAVIDSDKYELAQDDAYANLFHLEGNYSPEYLLSNNTVQDASSGYFIPWTFAIMNNWIWGNSYFTIHDWNKYMSFFNGVGYFESGYGFYNPTNKLANAFIDIEGKDGFRLNKTILSHDKMHSDVGAYLEGNSQHFEHVGWYRYKLLSRTSDHYIWTAWGGCALNLPAMRYAELLLMAAEAGYKTGDPMAVSYFNEVRQRAKAPTVSTLSMELIQNEFFVETCFEGHRYQDLQRWDKNGDIDMTEVLKDKGLQNVYFTTQVPVGNEEYPRVRTDFENDSWLYYVPATENRAGFSNYEKLLPYPQDELNVNPNIVQNEGWTTNN